jgi:hypothetical protein
MLFGLIHCARRHPTDLLFVLPALAIVVGTILPVHFVNFRYLMVVAYVSALFGGYVLSAIWAARISGTRWLGPVAVIIVFSWCGARAADLTFQMAFDSRYALGDWIEKHLRPGDQVGYFGGSQKLPRLPMGIVSVPMNKFCESSDWNSTKAPEFVVIIPQQHFEETHEWNIPAGIYERLIEGDLGYRLVYQSQTRGLSSRRPVPFVNPPVKVFARNDRAAELVETGMRIESSIAFLAGLESVLGLRRSRPNGLARNRFPRVLPPCVGDAS